MLLSMASLVVAAAVSSDTTNVATPADYGTCANQDVTGRMQQYVGFYGNVSMQVRNETTAGNVMYSKAVNTGKLYFLKNGATPTQPFLAASPSAPATDGNFSLTGWYASANHFANQMTVCGVASTYYLNTTDEYTVGLFKDSAADPNTNFGLCVDMKQVASTNGFGTTLYQVVVPKTASFTNYDIWYDLG